MAGQQQKMEEKPEPRAALPIMEEACDRRMAECTNTTVLGLRPVLDVGKKSQARSWAGQRSSELSLHASRDRADSTTPGGETPLCPSPLHP